MARRRRAPAPDPFLFLTMSQADASLIQAKTNSLQTLVSELRNLPPEAVSHAHSVLEEHKKRVTESGYKGGVMAVHKEMKVE
jgi:hypothetical protein